MNSLQSSTARLIVKMMRSTLFIHKTETQTHRVSFERISSITKFPRFVEMKEVTYAGLPAAWFRPQKCSDDKVILYYHGGGYSVGSYNTHRALIARIARAAGHPVLAINYRMAPEHPFSAALDDAVIAYKQLQADGWQSIFLAGDSAGGGLSLATTMKLREEGVKLPTAIVAISPWTDLTLSGDSVRSKADVDPLIEPRLLEIFAKKYYQEHDPKNPYISPLFGNFEGFPPIYIQVGGNEVLLDDSTRLAQKMKKAGVKVEFELWDHMMHVWHYLAGIVPEANMAIDKIGEYIQRTYDLSEDPNKSELHLEVY